MIRTFLLFGLASWVFLAGLGVSQAQETKSCDVRTAEITDLREPKFGATSVWDLLYAEDGMDVFADFVPLDETSFVAAGSFTKDKDDALYGPLIVKFDERLKPVWVVREDLQEQRTIHRIISTKDGFTVLGDIADPARGNGIYMASYTTEGKERGKPASVFERGGDLDAKAFVPAQDGGGYIIAAQFVETKDQENQYGLVYKLGNDGKIVWKRTYRPGNSTVFNSLRTTQDGTYIVGGQMVTEGGARSSAWLLLLDQDGAIKWQQTYPRGSAASVMAAAQTKEGDYIIVGKVRGFDAQEGQGLSAWVMKTDVAGNPLWQRFFRGEYDYEAADLIIYEDGRASVLFNAGAMDRVRRSHARLVTFSPQGDIHHLEDFTEGQNAAAHRLVAGFSGERVMIGHAQTSFGENQEGNSATDAPPYTYDAWLFAAEPLDVYSDPCARDGKMSPILP